MEGDEVGWFCLVFHHGMDCTGVLGFGNGFWIVDRFGVTLNQRPRPASTPCRSMEAIIHRSAGMATIRPISTGPVNNSKVLAIPSGSCTVQPS